MNLRVLVLAGSLPTLISESKASAFLIPSHGCVLERPKTSPHQGKFSLLSVVFKAQT